MNAKQMCIANVQYKKPTADDAKRQKGLLRYLTYRDGRFGHIKQQSGMERWVDHGLGGSISDIAERCDALKKRPRSRLHARVQHQPRTHSNDSPRTAGGIRA